MQTDKETVIKIDGVSKQYRLGMIGGTTLRDELQRKMAKLRHKEDPTLKIGHEQVTVNKRFWALKDISLEVKKGEALGIIGHNGAGKSTLLKLLCRVTAPTEGTLAYNGRIASMLEVGTGFHPELTGRENIYLNGAILGMTREEIDRKMEDIIEFSECRQFIDTPVKRYSSGMYVKLAFSVAAHLDAEIMIMDEVLAVGDMRFQQKCLGKMGNAAEKEGKTILYVSHNMNTIKQLCNRCIVLEHGRIVYNGDVEQAIDHYIKSSRFMFRNQLHNDFTDTERENWLEKDRRVDVLSLDLLNNGSLIYTDREKIKCKVKLRGNKPTKSVGVRFEFNTLANIRCGANIMPYEELFDLKEDEIEELVLEMDISNLSPDQYFASIIAYRCNEYGTNEDLDCIRVAFDFKRECNEQFFLWSGRKLGNVRFPDVQLLERRNI